MSFPRLPILFRKFIASGIALSFLTTPSHFLEAASLPATLSPVTFCPPMRFALPPTLGKVADYFNAGGIYEGAPEPRGTSETPVVILIQDFHAHYGVQKNIAALLEALTAKLSPSQSSALRSRLPFALAVEGAAGPIDSSMMALFPDKTIKESASEFMLRQGEMTGAEYFAVKQGIPDGLIGVENSTYYALHRDLFRKTLAKRQALVTALNEVQKKLLILPAHVYGPEVKRLRLEADHFNAGLLSPAEWITQLASHAREYGIPLESTYARLAAYQSNGPPLSAENLRSLIAEFLLKTQPAYSAEEKTYLRLLGKQGNAPYYLYLRELIEAHHLFLAVPTALARHLEFVHMEQTSALDDVLFEADQLSFQLQRRSAKVQTEKDLLDVEHDLALLLRVADLQATEQEVKNFGPRLNEFMALTKALLTSSSASPTFDEVAIRQLISSSLDYYVMATLRNRPLIENTLKLIGLGTKDSSHRPKNSIPTTAVLVAGGFHTSPITRILRAKNISYIVITPTVDAVTEADHALYIQRLNGQMLSDEEILRGMGTDVNPTARSPEKDEGLALPLYGVLISPDWLLRACGLSTDREHILDELSIRLGHNPLALGILHNTRRRYANQFHKGAEALDSAINSAYHGGETRGEQSPKQAQDYGPAITSGGPIPASAESPIPPQTNFRKQAVLTMQAWWMLRTRFRDFNIKRLQWRQVFVLQHLLQNAKDESAKGPIADDYLALQLGFARYALLEDYLAPIQGVYNVLVERPSSHEENIRIRAEALKWIVALAYPGSHVLDHRNAIQSRVSDAVIFNGQIKTSVLWRFAEANRFSDLKTLKTRIPSGLSVKQWNAYSDIANRFYAILRGPTTNKDFAINSAHQGGETDADHQALHRWGDFDRVIDAVAHELLERGEPLRRITSGRHAGRWDFYALFQDDPDRIIPTSGGHLRLRRFDLKKPVGSLFFIDNRFQTDHAGRGDYAVFARSDPKAAQEYSELSSWARWAHGEKLGRLYAFRSRQKDLGRTLIEWMNGIGEFKIPGGRSGARIPDALAARQTKARKLNDDFHERGLSDESDVWIEQKGPGLKPLLETQFSQASWQHRNGWRRRLRKTWHLVAGGPDEPLMLRGASTSLILQNQLNGRWALVQSVDRSEAVTEEILAAALFALGADESSGPKYVTAMIVRPSRPEQPRYDRASSAADPVEAVLTDVLDRAKIARLPTGLHDSWKESSSVVLLPSEGALLAVNPTTREILRYIDFADMAKQKRDRNNLDRGLEDAEGLTLFNPPISSNGSPQRAFPLPLTGKTGRVIPIPIDRLTKNPESLTGDEINTLELLISENNPAALEIVYKNPRLIDRLDGQSQALVTQYAGKTNRGELPGRLSHEFLDRTGRYMAPDDLGPSGNYSAPTGWRKGDHALIMEITEKSRLLAEARRAASSAEPHGLNGQSKAAGPNLTAEPSVGVSHGYMNPAVFEGLPRDEEGVLPTRETLDRFRPRPQGHTLDERVPIIPDTGLFQRTGALAHIGLGQEYGEPVMYVDADYGNVARVHQHEIFEIAWLNGVRQDNKLTWADMRAWMKQHPQDADRIARDAHNQAPQ